MYRADQMHALRKLGNVLVQYFGLGEVTGNITVLPPRLHSIDDDSRSDAAAFRAPAWRSPSWIDAGAHLPPGDNRRDLRARPGVF